MIEHLFEDSHTPNIVLYLIMLAMVIQYASVLSKLWYESNSQRSYKAYITDLKQDRDFWMHLANELAVERKVSGRTISPSVFQDLLAQGFENDEGAEKVLRQFLVIADPNISKRKDVQ